MSVHFFKRRNVWFAKWYDYGKEKRRYFPTEEEARAFDAERLANAYEDTRVTVGELTKRYFEANPSMHPRTKREIISLLAGREDDKGRHIEGAAEFLRDKFADALNRQDLLTLQNNKRKIGSGPNTINKAQAYLSAILTWGVQQEFVDRNPWRDCKRLKVTKPIVNATIHDLTKLYPHLPGYLQWAVKTAFFLCVRPGQVELYGLTWDAFDWRRGLVIVRQGKSGRIKTVVPHTAYMEEAHQHYVEDTARGIPWVVHRADGLRVLNTQTAWRNACKRAGIKMRPYDIRHIAATEMLARGADLAAVSAQLGHSSVVTTGTTYTHITQGSQAMAASLMPAICRSDTGSDTNSDT